MRRKPLPNASRTRREFLQHAAGVAAATAWGTPVLAALTAGQGRVSLPFDNGERELVAFPQKRPLIVLTSRPPQLETPFEVFNEGILTPNDAFFVRYHWSGIPTSFDAAAYRVRVGGAVNSPLDLSLDDLKRIADPVDLVAVNQCSGNSRGHFLPRVNGGQLSHGAMGNARWTGLPLKKVLEKAGVRAGATQVSFDGLDRPAVADGPDFVKALNIDHALDGDVLLAWNMNGTALPALNGYPLRLVVPGYYGTYWIKHLSDIQVLDKTYDGFWMSTAYRIPDNACACVEPGTPPARTTPIGPFNVRSFVTSLQDKASIAVGRETIVRGIAFDGGYGINEVGISFDGGRTWKSAALGTDLGRYSFREWTAPFTPDARGSYEIKVRASNRIGQSQPLAALWNPMGYMRNVVETIRVTAS